MYKTTNYTPKVVVYVFVLYYYTRDIDIKRRIVHRNIYGTQSVFVTYGDMYDDTYITKDDYNNSIQRAPV